MAQAVQRALTAIAVLERIEAQQASQQEVLQARARALIEAGLNSGALWRMLQGREAREARTTAMMGA